MFRNVAAAFIFTALAVTASPLLAENANPFTTAQELDLTSYLKPPPANDSVQTKRELAEVLSIQVTRTPEMEARAQADVVEDIWRFSDVMGPNFTKEHLPKFAAFFDRVTETEGAVVDPAKDTWKRPRPHQYSPLVHPAVKLSNSGAYPSGHATVGTLMGIVLSNMVPEQRGAIMDRAWEFAENRIIGGIHFRSDIEAGRIAGNLVAEKIMSQADFKDEYAPARAELRAELGLTP